MKKILEGKTVHLKKIYKFDFNHFLVKLTVFVLSIKNGFYRIKKSILPPNYARCEKILPSKIVYLKEIYKFDFDHFFVKGTVFVLIEKTLLKIIKNSSFRPNNARYEKMLTSKIVHLTEIYNFDFDHFLITRTVFVLIDKTLLKIIKNSSFRPNNARHEKMLTSKIVHHTEMYNFDFDHFLIKRTVFILIEKT